MTDKDDARYEMVAVKFAWNISVAIVVKNISCGESRDMHMNHS